MPKTRTERSIRLLVAVQAVTNLAILALLVIGVVVLSSTVHRTAESVALTAVHSHSGTLEDRLEKWLADEEQQPVEPPDLVESVREIHLATETIRAFGGLDAVKADDINRRLDAILAAVERMVESDNPSGVYSREIAPLVYDFEIIALRYEVEEIEELEESLGFVTMTGRLLVILGPLLVLIGLFTVRSTTRLRTSAIRAEHAEELVRSKDDFLARVSHEIRTPLTGIMGLSAILRDEELERQERSELIATVASQSNEMVGLVEVDSSIATLTESVSVNVDQGGVHAVGDPMRIRQVLRNLISNAFRHGGGDVVIDVSEHDGIAEIVVSDGGSAIAADDLAGIFEPYATRLGRTAYPGAVGVGLLISRDLARRMGGDLTYRHTGDRSEFVLDLVAAGSLSSATEKDADPAPNLEAA